MKMEDQDAIRESARHNRDVHCSETAPELPIDEEDSGTTRRNFLKDIGQGGTAVALAHFIAVGGTAGNAYASDDCPTYVSSDDNCDKSIYHWDRDECKPAEAEPYKAEVGDLCENDPNNPDVCVRPYTAAMGDECDPQFSSGDIQ